jgi:hypothetical protein
LAEATADRKKLEGEHSEEMDSLLMPYDGAYWAIYSSISPDAKVAKIKAHLQEMTPLSKALSCSWNEPEPIVVPKERSPLAPLAINLPEVPPPTTKQLT